MCSIAANAATFKNVTPTCHNYAQTLAMAPILFWVKARGFGWPTVPERPASPFFSDLISLCSLCHSPCCSSNTHQAHSCLSFGSGSSLLLSLHPQNKPPSLLCSAPDTSNTLPSAYFSEQPLSPPDTCLWSCFPTLVSDPEGVGLYLLYLCSP